LPEPYDEPAISGDDRIIRRINPKFHVVQDKNFNDTRISTQAFKPSNDGGGLSVDIEKLIVADGKNPKEWVITGPFTGAVSFRASDARSLGLKVGFDPIKGHATLPDNPYHGAVWGPDPKPHRISEGLQRKLLRASTWYVEIAGVAIR
jgi:hypothetical protein